MEILIKKATILSPSSKYHGKVRDILIRNGKIIKIGTRLSSAHRIIQSKDLHVSIGWLDLGTQIGEPGFEHRETIQSVSRAAALGGFTGIAPFPNTHPAISNKSEVGFLIDKFDALPVTPYPIAAITKNTNGTELAELIDLQKAGAIAFSDGSRPLNSDKLLLLALQYVKRINGLIIDNAINPALFPDATIHEGKTSVMLGLTGMPPLAETTRVSRNIALTKYTDSRCLVHNVSSSESISLLKKAKKNNLHVYASTPVLNLAFTEEENFSFNSLWKVAPPLRTTKDRTALIRALRKGIIDLITSNHVPVEIERKNLEFTYADPGSIGLQTVFGLALLALSDKMSLETIIEILSVRPRKILNIPIPKIEEGHRAELTLFLPNTPWTFEEKHIASLSKNTPLIGKTFPGQVLGTVHKGQFTGYEMVTRH